MAIKFKTKSVDFVESGKQSIEIHFDGNTVRSAEAAIKGFRIQHDSGDHELKEFEIDIINVEVSTGTDKVELEVDYNVMDNSSNFFRGTITVLVIADVEA